MKGSPDYDHPDHPDHPDHRPTESHELEDNDNDNHNNNTGEEEYRAVDDVMHEMNRPHDGHHMSLAEAEAVRGDGEPDEGRGHEEDHDHGLVSCRKCTKGGRDSVQADC